MSPSTQDQIAETIARGIRELEPLPATARELVGLLRRPEASLRPVTRLIELDEAIAARVLRAAGSAAYSGFGQPASVREAIARLGTARLLNLILRDYLQRLQREAPADKPGEDQLWAHSAAAELAVEAIMVERPRLELPTSTLSAALIHDIGKLVMSRYFRADCQEAVALAAAPDVSSAAAERRLFGTDHAQVGAAIGRAWSFPEDLVDAIARHHDEPLAASTPVLDAVVVANSIAKAIGSGLGTKALDLAPETACAERLGLDRPALARVCLRTEEWLGALRAALRQACERS